MSQKEFWNNKFSKEGYLYGKKPNAFLSSCLNKFTKNKSLLCLGEGEGRNAIYFAKNGFKVEAFDASDIGLKKLQDFAKEEGVEVNTKCIDLNTWETNKKYGTIIASYLHMYKNERKALFSKILESLESSGFFVGEFFSVKQLSYESGGPKDEELLYTVEDFKNLFSNCKYEKLEEVETILDEGKGHQGKACVIRIIIQKK